MVGVARPLLLHKGGRRRESMLGRHGWQCEQAGSVEREKQQVGRECALPTSKESKRRPRRKQIKHNHFIKPLHRVPVLSQPNSPFWCLVGVHVGLERHVPGPWIPSKHL